MDIQDKNTLTERYTRLFDENKATVEKGSSDLLNRMREIAIKRFAKDGIPGLKNENYKYTNLVPVFSKPYQLADENHKIQVGTQDTFQCDVPMMDTHQVWIVNGSFSRQNQNADQLPVGIVFGSLKQIANERPELVAGFLNRQAGLSDDSLVALNTAFAFDGFFLSIPKNVILEKPIQVINLVSSNEDVWVTQRNLVVVGENAQVKLIFCDHTNTQKGSLSNAVTEVFVGDRAMVDFYLVQNQHNQANLISNTFFRLENQSNLLAHTSTLHGGLVRNNLKVTFNGEHSEATVMGMSFTDRNQHVDNFTMIEHAKPNCNSNQLYKNVLDDQSTGAFAGRIHVARDAQKTNAFQRNNNILLTDTAWMQTKPQLIIDADDVKCSHGATIGQIDQEALFFLRSRGISEANARLMLMSAFTYEVIQNIRIEALKERMNELVEQRLSGELAKCYS